jgi:uncharacterized protein (UPF0335 family)
VNSDITERKQGEEMVILQREQLRALADRLQRVREEDRKKVARDLHDEIGQILTSIKMDMKWISRRLPDSEGEVRNRLQESLQSVDEGVKSVRAICSRLRPEFWMIWAWRRQLNGRPANLNRVTASAAGCLFRLSICTWTGTGLRRPSESSRSA